MAFIQGCSKSDIDQIDIKKPIINKSVTIEGNVGMRAPDNRTLHMWPIRDEYGNVITWIILGCAWPSWNCLPTVVITPEQKTPTNDAYKDFIEKFKSNNLDEFFALGDYISLFPNVANLPEVVREIVASKINFYYEVGTDGFDYYIGLPKEVDYHSDWTGQEKVVFVIDNQIK
jgi:hypothetical protein